MILLLYLYGYSGHVDVDTVGGILSPGTNREGKQHHRQERREQHDPCHLTPNYHISADTRGDKDGCLVGETKGKFLFFISKGVI